MTGPVSVVVVNYNGAAYLPACLAALATQTLPRHAFEVVVIDNASRDGSGDAVRAGFPWVRLVRLPANRGFAGGNNAAVPYCHGTRLVLLNPDTVPDPHFLAELVRAADANPHGTAAGKLVFRADPGKLNSTGLTLLRDGRGADRGFRQPDRGQFERREPVFAGCGAALLLPKPARGSDVFDGRLFLYAEDLDRGWRDRLGGAGPVYAPRAVVSHEHGAAAGDESAVFWFYAERNRALVALKNGDPALVLLTALVLAAKVPEAVVRSARGPRVGRGRWSVTRAVGAAFLSYLWHAPAVLAGRLARGGRCG